MGFANKESHVPFVYSKIYLPAAHDSSIYSGNSSRLSTAVRRILAQRTDVKLSPLSEARIALQIRILDRVQTIVTVDNCQNPGTPFVGNLAFSCAKIHPELAQKKTNDVQLPSAFNQPSISPNTENLSLAVAVKAIDLNTGETLWGKNYFANNIAPIVFNEIGDTDNRASSGLAQTPQLHGLRYQEAIDNAVESFSNAIAADLQTALFASLSKNQP